MLVQEEFFENNVLFCDTGLYETYTDNIRKLFKSYQKEHGRCVSKIYIDGCDKPIGWVFQKTAKYEDTKNPHLQEVWVTLHDEEPERTIKYKYHYLK